MSEFSDSAVRTSWRSIFFFFFCHLLPLLRWQKTSTFFSSDKSRYKSWENPEHMVKKPKKKQKKERSLGTYLVRNAVHILELFLVF